MKTKLGHALLVVAMLVAGCVPSLNPVYNEDQLFIDPIVLGIWDQSDNRWEFSKRDSQSYRLIYTETDGRQGRFIACLAEIDGMKFLDLFPEEIDPGTSGFYKYHQVPIHTIYLVKQISDETLKLAVIDYHWLDQYLTNNPGCIEFVTFNGRKMLTASTEDVQAFVLEHQEMFTGDISLVRASSNVH